MLGSRSRGKAYLHPHLHSDLRLRDMVRNQETGGVRGSLAFIGLFEPIGVTVRHRGTDIAGEARGAKQNQSLSR